MIAQGLYDPANEHDACGVGFIAHIKGNKSHSIVEQGLLILKNLDHRGAVGADAQLMQLKQKMGLLKGGGTQEKRQLGAGSKSSPNSAEDEEIHAEIEDFPEEKPSR